MPQNSPTLGAHTRWPLTAEWDQDRFRTAAKRLVMTVGACLAGALAFPYPTTKFVVGAVLGSQYLVWLGTDMGLALSLVAFSIPVQDMTPASILALFPGSNISTILLGLLVIVWLTQGSSLPIHLRAPFPLRFPVTVFTVACSLAVLQSWILHGMELGYLTGLWKGHFGPMLLMVVAFRCLDRREQRGLVFASVVLVDFLVALQSVIDYGGGVRERSAGLIGGQPNLYGGFLAMQIPFFFAICFSRDLTKRIRFLAAIALVVLLQAFFLTGSRGAWLACAAGVTLIVLLANRRAFIGLVVAYALIPMISYGFNAERLKSVSQLVEGSEEAEEDASVRYRMAVWSNLDKLVTPPYIWGDGYARSPAVVRRLGISDKSEATHSSIVTLLIEMGIVGLGLYCWMLAGVWKHAFVWVRASQTALGRCLATGFIGAVPALIICDISGGRFYNGEIMAFFWLLGGILLREVTDGKEARRPRDAMTLRAKQSSTFAGAPTVAVPARSGL